MMNLRMGNPFVEESEPIVQGVTFQYPAGAASAPNPERVSLLTAYGATHAKGRGCRIDPRQPLPLLL